MRKIVSLLLLAVLLGGCSASHYGKGRKLTEQGQYDRAIASFYEEIARYPQRHEAWRELGIAYYEKGDLIKAEDALKQANGIQPDSRTHLYLGLIYEQNEMLDKAVAAYGTALGLGASGKTGSLIRAHLDDLIARQMKVEVNEAIANEQQIDVSQIPEHTVAVVNFDDTHLSADMAPLARGLAEFTAIDLGKVKSLRVVDRLKIDMILEELALSSSGAVDPATGPRVGRLLGTQHIVGGQVLDLGGEGIRLDGVLVDTRDSSSSLTVPAEGRLDHLFDVQKAFVFSVIDDLGIELTAEERDAISEVPTESYLAFLAYSRGLDYQSRGFNQDAQASFRQATVQDPGFSIANDKAVTLEAGLSLGADYSLGQFASAVSPGVESPQPTGGVDSRLQAIGSHMGVIPENGLSRVIDALPGLGTFSIVVIRVDINVDGI
jgi:tetratricopeptide (TPR) repeat protein